MSEKVVGKPYTKGTSGNPGGRPNIAKAWEAAAGKTRAEVTAEMLKLVRDRALLGPNGSVKGDADWRFAVEKSLNYSAGLPKQEIELSGEVSTQDPMDWTSKPVEERRQLLEMALKLGATDDGPTEH